uniref:Uncharacterized protein n=1 Tax=Timema bartmani TaxID=61472 RepID=A0A7R9HVK3_9NEOP|nr:unnamed protein product [Timema bartmani]
MLGRLRFDPGRDLNPNFPVIGSLVFCESYALDHAVTEFRRSVADCCTKPYHDDHYLLRWLRDTDQREGVKHHGEEQPITLEKRLEPSFFSFYVASSTSHIPMMHRVIPCLTRHAFISVSFHSTLRRGCSARVGGEFDRPVRQSAVNGASALCSVSFLPRKETVCLARNFNPEAAEKMLRESVAILANSGRRDLNSRTSRKTQPRSLTFGTKLLSPGMATFIYNKALAGWAGFFFAPTRMPERQ